MRSGVRPLVFIATLSALAISGLAPAAGVRGPGPAPTPVSTTKPADSSTGRTLWQFETGG
jgi:hypothetical protein